MTFHKYLSNKKGAAYSFFSAMTKTAVPAALTALFHLILSVILPVTEFISINTAAKEDLTGNSPTADKVLDFLICGRYGSLDTALIYIILAVFGFISILTAVKVFSFICDKKTVNVYYSLGIKRSVLYISRYLGGALSLALATAIPLTLSYFVNLIFLGASVQLSLSLLHMFTGFYIFSLICYSITAAVFSSVGTVAEAEIFSIAIIFAPSVLIFVFQQIITAFLPSAAYGIYAPAFEDDFYNYTSATLLEQTQRFNPLLFFTDDISMFSGGTFSQDGKVMLNRGKVLWENPATYELLPWFIVCIAASLIGLFLFKRIKAENCGFLDTNKVLSNITTFGMCLTGASLLLGEMQWEPPVIVLGIGAFIAFILYIAAEIFLKRNFRKILKSLYKFVAHIAVIAIIFGIFYSGAFGFDKYIPDRKKVVSAEISVPFSYSEITTANMGYGWNSDMFMRVFEPYEYRFLPVITDEKDIDTLMDIHKYINENDTEDGISNNVLIRYNYADGSFCERLLPITNREEITKLFTLFDMPSYKNELNNLFYKENRLEEIYEKGKDGHYVDDKLITALCFEYEFSDIIIRTDSLNEHSLLNLSEEEFNSLKDAVYNDLYKMSAEEHFTGNAKQLGVLSFSVNEKAYELEGINGFYGYDGYMEDVTSVTQIQDKNETTDTDTDTETNTDTSSDKEDSSENKLSNVRTESVSEYPFETLGSLSSSGSYDIVITENMKNTVSLLDSLGLLGLFSSDYEIESVTLREYNVNDIFSYYSNLGNRNFMLEFFAYSLYEDDYYSREGYLHDSSYITVTDKKTVDAIAEKAVLHEYTFGDGYFCLIKYKNGNACVKYLSEEDLPEKLNTSF